MTLFISICCLEWNLIDTCGSATKQLRHVVLREYRRIARPNFLERVPWMSPARRCWAESPPSPNRNRKQPTKLTKLAENIRTLSKASDRRFHQKCVKSRGINVGFTEHGRSMLCAQPNRDAWRTLDFHSARTARKGTSTSNLTQSPSTEFTRA